MDYIDYQKKYLKYKAKYLKLKNMSGGVNLRLERESELMKRSGKYKSVDLKKEENTLYVTLNNDQIIKIVVTDSYPHYAPLFFLGEKYILPILLNWGASKKISDYLDKLDDYPLVDYKDIKPSEDIFIDPLKSTTKSYIDIEILGIDKINNSNIIRISLENGEISNGKTLLNALEYHLRHHGYLISGILIGPRNANEITDDDFSLIRDKKMKLYISLTKLHTVSEFIEMLKSHEFIKNISKLKPVATNLSGAEPKYFAINWNLYQKLSQKRILDEMSKFLSEKNGYPIKFSIATFDKTSSSSYPIIYYSEEHLEKLSKLFEYESLEKSLEVLSVFNYSYPVEIMDFIYIAFGDIDITKEATLDSFSENGKRLYSEYMKD